MTAAEFIAARKSFGLTQTAWGLALGLTRGQVTRIEIGHSRITPTVALLVCAYVRHGLPEALDASRGK